MGGLSIAVNFDELLMTLFIWNKCVFDFGLVLDLEHHLHMQLSRTQ